MKRFADVNHYYRVDVEGARFGAGGRDVGSTRFGTKPCTSKWKFATHERDSESGLDYAVFELVDWAGSTLDPL